MTDVESSPITLGSMGAAIRRSWPIVATAVVVAAAVAVGWALVQHSKYSATATVVLANQSAPSSLGGSIQLPGNYAVTQADLARSEQVAASALHISALGETADWLLARSTVTASPTANLLDFQVESGTRGEAIRLANDYATAFVNYRQGTDTQVPDASLADLDKRLEQAQRRLVRSAGSGSSNSETLNLYSALVSSREQLQTLRSFLLASTSIGLPATKAASASLRPTSAAVFGVFWATLGLAATALANARAARRTRPAPEREGIRSASPSENSTGERHQAEPVGAGRGPRATSPEVIPLRSSRSSGRAAPWQLGCVALAAVPLGIVAGGAGTTGILVAVAVAALCTLGFVYRRFLLRTAAASNERWAALSDSRRLNGASYGDDRLGTARTLFCRRGDIRFLDN